MKRALTLALLALAACSQQEPAAAPKDAAVTTIALPAETAAFPATPAGELLTQKCTACHSADFVLGQPPLDAAKWQAEVTKMREAYHATYSPAEDEALVAALLTIQGKTPAAAPAPAAAR